MTAIDPVISDTQERKTRRKSLLKKTQCADPSASLKWENGALVFSQSGLPVLGVREVHKPSMQFCPRPKLPPPLRSDYGLHFSYRSW